MTKETDNLVLEHLRALRADMTAMSRKIDELRGDMNSRFATLSQRLDHMDGRLQASQYVLTATLGSILSDHEDLKARVGALEPS